MSDIKQARNLLVKRILEGPGEASPSERKAAFNNRDVAGPVAVMVEKVASHACRVTDEDISAAMASGLSEDQLFEIVVCAAVGKADRQYGAALSALDAASRGE